MAIAIGLMLVAILTTLLVRSSDSATCATGFVRVGPRCCPPASGSASLGACARAQRCPPPLIESSKGCVPKPNDTIEIPAMSITVGPSDWEAEGRVVPRVVKVSAFRIDRFEVTVGEACGSAVFERREALCRDEASDPARAAFGVTLSEAREHCRAKGGRLPTEDEWLAAAAGERVTRYPWGDTGAVCRRAAWGLVDGPCGEGATGPDTVGSHAGATPRGVHDLAGNVDEWVEGPPCAPGASCPAIARGGSFRSRLATELRTWLRREVLEPALSTPGADPSLGFRCAYDEPP